MGKIIAIGEALIDFISLDKNVALKNVSSFKKEAGGAPANVAVCASMLGGVAQVITKLGQDAFGDFLFEKISAKNVITSSILRTNEANTTLAFVSIKNKGERDFSFYRNPGADMLLSESDIQEKWFEEDDILHFCSVDLIDAPVRYAHDKAIKIARQKNMIISFDPNVRLALWENKAEYKKIINMYIYYADILKISNDELFFITDTENEKDALNYLLEKVKILIYTKGEKGAEIYINKEYIENDKDKNYINKYKLKGLNENSCLLENRDKTDVVRHSGFKVKAIDTTGAGDTFIASFLYQFLKNGGNFKISKDCYEKMLKFSNAAAAIVAMRIGAIDAMPTLAEVEEFLTLKG